MTRKEVPALKVHQWLGEWEKVPWDVKALRGRPDQWFYLFRLPAGHLRALSGIYRREPHGPRALDLGIERRHDPKRSEEIHAFVKYGFPWSDMSEDKRQSGKYNDLRKPGWLPTAIVVNILKSGESRMGSQVAKEDAISIDDQGDDSATIHLPEGFTGRGWKPHGQFPLEVIDGQHRLWAFETGLAEGGFELPVVAFHGLGLSWQAYLFYTINIKPKRINTSLAFDLYPLLRTENWLEKFEGHSIYRETRAQELTEALWSHPKSPWHERINMLGEPKKKGVSQAAWVRSLMATYVKLWEGPGVKIGGLFGAPAGADKQVIPWSRSQQAAFLIFVWQKVRDAVKLSKEPWARALRKSPTLDEANLDPAFGGDTSLLSTDQGVRGILYVTNDCCYVAADELELADWALEQPASAVNEAAVEQGLRSLADQDVSDFLEELAETLSTYDWRTAIGGGLTEEQRTAKLAFRGSSGYRELRRQLILHCSRKPGRIATAASDVARKLGYA